MCSTVDSVIDALGGTGQVADALSLKPPTVSSWRARGSIPSEHWFALVGRGRELGAEGVTLEALARLGARNPASVEAAE